MSKYRDTLNLPHTDFPMRAGLAQREPEQLAAWERMDLYPLLRSEERRVVKECRSGWWADQ